MSTSRPLTAILVTALFAAAGLAGCFAGNPGTDEDSENRISREYSIHLDMQKQRDLNQADSPAEFIRTLVDTALVVRVAEKGDYVLEYEDEDGVTQRATLSGVEPGAPRTVEGADAFTAARLTKGATTIATRDPIAETWWQVGPIPVGARGSAPVTAEYTYRALSTLEASVRDITSNDGRGRLDSASISMSLPASGTVGWTLENDGTEERLAFTGTFQIDDTRGSLFHAEASGVMDGEPATAGVEVVSGDAVASGGISLWLRDGSFTAGRFDGASIRADPEVYLWRTGAAAQDGGSCAGATREDRCVPDEVDAIDESEDASEREEFETDDIVIEDQDDREALDLVKKLFAQDLGLKDRLVITASVRSSDFEMPPPNQFSVSYLHEIVVEKQERVSVRAGSFDALRIAQTASLNVDVDRLEGGDDETLLSNYELDESFVRSTIWLDAATFQPLKGEVDAPADVGAILRDLIGRVDENAWAMAGLESFDANDLRLSADSSSTFEATRLNGDFQMAPFVGLVAGTLLTGTVPAAVSPIFGGMGYLEPPSLYEGAYATPTRPTAHWMSVYSEQPVEDGVGALVVSSSSYGTTWSDIMITVDGTSRSFSFAAECPGPGEAWEYVACSGSTLESFRSTIDAGDTIHFADVASGTTVRLIDVQANSVLASVTLY